MRSTTDQESWAGDYEAFIRSQSRGAARAEPAPATRDGWERRLYGELLRELQEARYQQEVKEALRRAP